MVEFYPVRRNAVDLGDFPLNHDCILKVVYIRESPLRFQYFSCREQDSGLIMDLLSKLSLVREVKISLVSELPDIF